MRRKREENRYLDIVQNVSDAVYTVDLATKRFSSVNKAALVLTGYTKKELLSIPFMQIIPLEYQPLVLKMIAQKLRKNVSTIYELEIIRKDGLKIPIEVSSRLVMKDGKPLEVLGIARDIAERKKAQHEKEIFISLLTHEIKNPLTSMTVYLQMLQRWQKKAGHEKAGPYVIAIQQQITALTNIMNDFLEVNQIELGKFKITKQKYNVFEQIKEILTAYQHQTHKIKFTGDTDSTVRADKNRIAQVLNNLINNAIKYSPKNSEIIVRLKKDEKALTVSIQDKGVGIGKSDLKQIFQLFYRTKYSRQSQIKGHGLGLYITQQIILSHKGKIWVESEEGKGSTFYFTLPLR